MSSGSTGDGRSSAAARLAARAARPAVRVREEFLRSHVAEPDRLEADPTPGADPPARPAGTQKVQSTALPVLPARSAPVEVAMRPAPRPPVADEAASSPHLEPARDAPREAPAPALPSAMRVEQHDAEPRRVAAAQLPTEDAPFHDLMRNLSPPMALVDSLAPAGLQPVVTELEARQDAPGWQSLAEPQQSDARPETRVDPQPAVAAAARARARTEEAPRAMVAPSPHPAAPSASVAVLPPGQPQPPAELPPSGPPQVLIDRIEVITPAAAPAAPDPFLSLAARRVGASRHGGSS